jgi:hypothetical protein
MTTIDELRYLASVEPNLARKIKYDEALKKAEAEAEAGVGGYFPKDAAVKMWMRSNYHKVGRGDRDDWEQNLAGIAEKHFLPGHGSQESLDKMLEIAVEIADELELNDKAPFTTKTARPDLRKAKVKEADIEKRKEISVMYGGTNQGLRITSFGGDGDAHVYFSYLARGATGVDASFETADEADRAAEDFAEAIRPHADAIGAAWAAVPNPVGTRRKKEYDELVARYTPKKGVRPDLRKVDRPTRANPRGENSTEVPDAEFNRLYKQFDQMRNTVASLANDLAVLGHEYEGGFTKQQGQKLKAAVKDIKVALSDELEEFDTNYPFSGE